MELQVDPAVSEHQRCGELVFLQRRYLSDDSVCPPAGAQPLSIAADPANAMITIAARPPPASRLIATTAWETAEAECGRPLTNDDQMDQ